MDLILGPTRWFHAFLPHVGWRNHLLLPHMFTIFLSETASFSAAAQGLMIRLMSLLFCSAVTSVSDQDDFEVIDMKSSSADLGTLRCLRNPRNSHGGIVRGKIFQIGWIFQQAMFDYQKTLVMRKFLSISEQPACFA